MAVKKISIALDPDIAAAASVAADARGQSLSAWLNDAARHQLRIEMGLAGVAEWERAHGVLSPGERVAADTVVRRLLRNGAAEAM